MQCNKSLLELAEINQFCDQLVHLFGLRHNLVHLVGHLGRKMECAEDGFYLGDDEGERTSQFVAHRREKTKFGLVQFLDSFGFAVQVDVAEYHPEDKEKEQRE